MITIQPLSQMDPQWKNVKLGADGSTTIGKYGCLLTCLTMVANGFDYHETPASLNDKMKSVGGFQGPLIIPAYLPKTLQSLRFKKYTPCHDYPAPIDEIDATLASNLPVIVEVDYSPNPGLQNHWVVIYDKKGEDYLIRDPWPFPTETKEVTLTSRYGFAGKPPNIITGAIWIEGAAKPQPPTPQPQPKPITDTGLAVYASVDGLALRGEPVVSETNLIKRVPIQTKFFVTEDQNAAKGKIGQQGQWLQVQETVEGYEGFIAAWYVSTSPEPAPIPEPQPQPPIEPEPGQTPSGGPAPSTSTGIVYTMVEDLAFRNNPNIFSSIIKRVPSNAQFAVLEPLDQLNQKVGAANQWLRARDIEGDTGYVAAWYVSLFRQEAVGAYKKITPPTPASTPPTGPTRLVVRAAEDGLALRNQTLIAEATLIKRYPILSEFLVLEPTSLAETKIGVLNQWLKVRDILGQEGYVAAWYVVRR